MSISDPQFVFLIGAARSGTKFVRDTLAASQAVAGIPYDVNPIWRRGHESLSHDEFPVSSANQSTAVRLKKTFLGKARRVNARATIVLEKTVSNCLRAAYVARLFPDAKFLFLVRDGRAVVESSSRVWSQPTGAAYKLRKLAFLGLSDWSYFHWYVWDRLCRRDGQHTWGPRYRGIDEDLENLSLAEVCATQWTKCNEAIQRDSKVIPENQVFWIRYEDFVAEESNLEAVCEFLRLPDSERVLERFRDTVQENSLGKWKDAFEPDEREKLGRIMNRTLRKLKYGEIGG